MTASHEPLQRFKVFYSSSVLALRVSAFANLVLVTAVALLVYNLYGTRAQMASWKPLVIRVDQAGKAEPVDLTLTNDPPTELEAKVFAADYINNIASFDPYTVNRDLGLAINCTDEACARQLVTHFQSDPEIKKLRESNAVLQCKTNAVQILRTDPWEIRVEYTLTNLATGEPRAWYALLSLKPATRSFNNPFGFLVTGVRINTTLH
jgi:type IV secretory pathway TrbF-like protein